MRHIRAVHPPFIQDNFAPAHLVAAENLLRFKASNGPGRFSARGPWGMINQSALNRSTIASLNSSVPAPVGIYVDPLCSVKSRSLDIERSIIRVIDQAATPVGRVRQFSLYG